MARIRTIKPEFPQSESMGRVSREARLCFVLLWTIADDSGRLRGNSRMLASLLYPYDDDAPKLIDGWLDELENERCIQRYDVDGDRYLAVCAWEKHQKIDKPTASKIDAPPPISVTPREDVARIREDSRASREDSTTDLGMDQGMDQGEEAPSPPPPPPPERKKPKRSMPSDFAVSPRVAEWAKEHGHGQLREHLDAFRLKATASGYTYADWDAAFMTAIRDDWARLRTPRFGQAPPGTTVADNPQVAETRSRLDAEAKRDLTVDPARIATARALIANRKGATQ